MARSVLSSLLKIALCLTFCITFAQTSVAQELISALSNQTDHGQEAAPSPSQSPAQQQQPLTRNAHDRRAQAFAKILEGERLILALRANAHDAATRSAAQAAFQEAARLDPTLAEPHTV